MNVQLFVVTLVLTFQTIFTQRGSECRTPNNETATCTSVRSCKPIADAISTNESDAIDFAKKSQCGYDTEPLVCCGAKGYFDLGDLLNIFTKAPDPFDIFTKTPEVTTETVNKQQETILSNFNPNGLPDRTVCGIDSATSRIIGGNVTEMDEFPWMAALEYKSTVTGENVGVRCGGTVINNRHVLTAAHCMLNREFELIIVRLGEWKLSTDPDCETSKYVDTVDCADNVLKLKIKDLIPHPFYSARSGDNDIGLLRLENDINYTNYIRPICLPRPELPLPEQGTKLTVTGWGATENGTSSDVKQKVAVPLITNAKCHEKFSNKRRATANQLCAGGEEGKDSCRGDSGGPLMRMYEDKVTMEIQWYQEGVVSHGVGCGRLGYPAIYTRVNRYISWIINNIKDSHHSN